MIPKVATVGMLAVGSTATASTFANAKTHSARSNSNHLALDSISEKPIAKSKSAFALSNSQSYDKNIKLAYVPPANSFLNRDNPTRNIIDRLFGNNTQEQSNARNNLERLQTFMKQRMGDSHFLGRHGAHTTREMQKNRALHGILPDKPNSPPEKVKKNATRFASDKHMLEAYHAARKYYKAFCRNQPRCTRTIDMEKNMGEGYKALTDQLVNTTKISFIFDKGVLITLHPEIRDK